MNAANSIVIVGRMEVVRYSESISVVVGNHARCSVVRG